MLELFDLFALQGWISTIVYLVIFAVEAFAVVDAASRPAPAYVAGDKLNKQAWLIILGLALLVHVLLNSFLDLIGLVAALVYLLDVRPTLRELTRR